MRKCFIILIAVVFAVCMFFTGDVTAAVTSFTHTDDNPHSPRSGTLVGPYDAINRGKVTVWYHQYNEY